MDNETQPAIALLADEVNFMAIAGKKERRNDTMEHAGKKGALERPPPLPLFPFCILIVY